MIFLVARIVVLLLLAALFGFLLGRWWLRRSFVDVTESYEAMAAAASDAPWNQLWTKFDELDGRINTLPKPEKPVAVDFGPTNRRIEQIEAAIANLPKPEKPAAVDFGPTNRRIEQIEAAIANLPKPEKPAAVDFGPTNRRIEQIEAAIANLPRPEKPAAVDFGPTNRRIEQIEAAIANLPRPEKPAAVDFGPTNRRIEQIEVAIANLPRPEKPTEEFGTVMNKLQLIDAQLSKVALKANQPKPKQQGPRLLRSASYGRKDDLTKISGVGPKLERLLNRNGVYYFWQVADWRKRDVKTMDDRLEVFKGRITRDDWVRQAAGLVRNEPKAAQRPAE